VAVFPFYVQFALASLDVENVRVIRVLRLVRVSRLFKMSRWMSSMSMFLVVIQKSISSLSTILFIILLIVVAFSRYHTCVASCVVPALITKWVAMCSILYTVEGSYRDDDFIAAGFPKGSPFTSIPATMYFCFATLTCVGYGDVYPLSGLGKAITVVVVMMGSLMITMPLSVLSTHFQQVCSVARCLVGRVDSWVLTQRRLRGWLHRNPECTTRVSITRAQSRLPQTKR